MAVTSHRARVFYVVVPKAACTSVKVFFRDLEEEADARRPSFLGRLFGGGKRARPIHNVDGYRTVPFDEAGPVPEGYARISVVRDPLMRLQSAWSNKVCRAAFEARGEVEAIRARGLPVDPSFAAFVENYEAYREVSRPAHIHTRPLAWHLGGDVSWYDRLFKLEELGAFEAFISERVGRAVSVPRENKGHPDARPFEFAARHVGLVRGILAEDYRLLGRLYDFDRSLGAFGQKNGIGV
jgi:hypothetical protein